MNASRAWAGAAPVARSFLLLSLVCLTGLLTSACARRDDLALRTPRLVADADALARALARAEQIQGTPLAREAGALRARIEGCQAVAAVGDADAPDRLLEGLHCIERSEKKQAAGPHALGDAALLVWPVGADGFARVDLAIDERGGVRASIELEPPSDPGWLALLIPGDEPPGPAAFDPSGALLHARMRPAALPDLTSLAAMGGGLRAGEGDPFDAIKQRLAAKVAASLFDGSWELGVYPAPGGAGPPLFVVAIEHGRRSLAERAVEGIVADLERSWPIRHAARRFRDADGAQKAGACFDDLNLLPLFQPCWIVDDERIVVGWNAQVIDRALGGRAPTAAGRHRAVVHLDRIANADAAGRPGLAPEHPAAAWRRLELETSAEARGAVHVEVRLPATEVQS